MRSWWLVALVLLAVTPGAAPQPPGWADGAYNPFGHEPVRIVLDFSNLSGPSAPYADEVRTALAWWVDDPEDKLAWNFSFVEVADRGEADIVLWFRDSGRTGPTCGEDESALGCARPFERPVSIEMLTRLTDGTFRPYQLIREVSIHELGHALGLPHSDAPGDIMAPHASYRASTAWRPGDLERLLVGTAISIGLIVLLVALWLRLARRAAGREVRALSAEEARASCPRGGGEPHVFAREDVRVRGRLQPLLVCRRCRGARPLSGDDHAVVTG